jgi:hypothetical protein
MQSQVKARGKQRARKESESSDARMKITRGGMENCQLPVHQVENIEPGDENLGTVRFLRLASNDVVLRVYVVRHGGASPNSSVSLCVLEIR